MKRRTAAPVPSAIDTRDALWIVNQYAIPPDDVGGSRHYDLGRVLVAHGLPVTIFAASAGHATGVDARLGRWQLFRTGRINGVRFVWLRTLPYRGNTWRRPINMLSFCVVFLLVQARLPAPRVIIGSTVHPFAALAAWLASKFRHARFIFEVRDLWPQTLVDLGAMRLGSAGERLLRRIEAFLVRRAAVVITLLPGTRQYLAEHGLPTDHLIYLPNGADLAAFEAPDAPREAQPETVTQCLDTVRRLRADGRIVLGYLGAFGRVNRVDVIVRAAAHADAAAPGCVAVVLVGDGPERARLDGEVQGVPAVAICPSVPKRSVPAILNDLDATIVHATANPVYRYGVSFNKLFEYMAAGKPVVFGCASAYDPVASTGAGLTVPPDDPEAMAQAILNLAAMSVDERRAMGRAGRAYVTREHDIEALGARLAAIVGGASQTADQQ